MNEKLLIYLESTFLKDLIKDPDITDISFNGIDLYYQHNLKGRLKSEIRLNNEIAFNFIRQIANLTDSQFSYKEPILDISIDKFRINATHFAIARKNKIPSINFSIRINFEELRIKEDKEFINSKCQKLIEYFINNKESIVIGGVTSSGKTELQKYLISTFKKSTRVIIIDNVEELETDEFSKNIDSQTWLIKSNNNVSFESLIKNALRNNPDWLIVSEARGKEMLDLLNATMTGHPTISTMHSKNINFMYKRMGRMCLLNGDNLKYKEILEDIYDHFKLLLYVEKKINEDGTIKRYLSKIGTNILNKYYEIYSYPNIYNPLPEFFMDLLSLNKEEFNKLKEYWINNLNSMEELPYEKNKIELQAF